THENFQVRHILVKVSISLFNLQGAISLCLPLFSDLICSNKQTQRYKTQSVYPKLLFSLPELIKAPRIDKVIIRSSYCSIFKEQVSSLRSLLTSSLAAT
ncbi:MAG: hypothetical protein J6C38_09265, partial [Oscillospiraceae bacterium]|nr:hypothetical protein [Oscillospiraceae bacterium]